MKTGSLATKVDAANWMWASSKYGTRDAARNWETAYTEQMQSMSFKVGALSWCLYHNVERNIKSMVHGDDFSAWAGMMT